MAIQISGRLTVASGDQLSFEGCRVEAVFDERRPTGARASAVCDAKGTFTLEVLDHDEFPGETIRFVALSPTGRRIGAREFVAALGEHNEQVLRDCLGLTRDQVGALASSGVLRGAASEARAAQ